MQVSFRYTDREYLHSRSINKLLGWPQWKSLGLALVCLLPSVVLVMFTFSWIALIAFTAIAIFLIVMLCWAFVKQPKLVDKFDHVATFSDSSLHETSSHSQYELRWQHIDEFIESETEFLLRRLERFIVYPKRIFTPEQCDQFRTLAGRVKDAHSESDPPIQLYSNMFLDDQNRVYRFTYQAEDLVQAAKDPLALVDSSGMDMPGKKPGLRGRMTIVWLATFVLCTLFLLRPPDGSGAEWSVGQFLVLAGVVCLPFVLLIGLNKLLRSHAAKRLPQVPRDENNLVLLKHGFAIGTPNNVTFFDWRDIDAFYQNKTCYGFKSFNDLIQVIPKRIFSDEKESADFLNQAISLHREFRRTFEVTATAVETGNPYQPPGC